MTPEDATTMESQRTGAAGPERQVVAIPIWVATGVFGTLLTVGVAMIGVSVRIYTLVAVQGERIEQQSDQIRKLEAKLDAAASDRFTGSQAAELKREVELIRERVRELERAKR